MLNIHFYLFYDFQVLKTEKKNLIGHFLFLTIRFFFYLSWRICLVRKNQHSNNFSNFVKKWKKSESNRPIYLRHKSTDKFYHILAKLKSWNKKDQNLLCALCKVISTKSKSKKRRGRKFPDSYFAEISSEICKISKNQCSNFS